MPILRNKYIWYPVYVYIFFYTFLNLPRYKAFMIIFGLVAVVSLGDLLSGQVLKKSIKRPRPCNELALADHLINRVQCGNSYSFPSSHATNHFAISTFLILGLSLKRKMKAVVIVWASAIAYAQVYVGLHYPLDVIAGAVLGIVVARFIYNIFLFSGPNPPTV